MADLNKGKKDRKHPLSEVLTAIQFESVEKGARELGWLGKSLFSKIFRVGREFAKFLFHSVSRPVVRLVTRVPRAVRQGDVRRMRIAVEIGGGYGDFANRLAFLHAFHRTFQTERLDVLTKDCDVIEKICSGSAFYFRTFDSDRMLSLHHYYDVVILATNWISVKVNRPRRLWTHCPELFQALEKTKDRRDWATFFSHKEMSLDGVFAKTMSGKGFDVVSGTGYFLDVDVDTVTDMKSPYRTKAQRIPALAEIGTYITIHDGVGTTVKSGTSSKQWPIGYWNTLVRRIRQDFPNLKVVQIGGPRSRTIDGVDFNFIGKVSVAESIDILAKSRLHIDGESGHVRLAYTLGVKSVVLFGPSIISYYELPGNITVEPRKCGGCAFIRHDWMSHCPRGLEEPECMSSILPETVFGLVRNELSQ